MKAQERGVAIVTTGGDAHAYLVCEHLRASRGVPCHVFDIDAATATRPVAISIGGDAIFSDHFGEAESVSRFSVCWWRRFYPKLEPGLKEGRLRGLQASAVHQSFLGGFLSAFSGTNISSPYCTINAENKILQLDTAQRLGLRIPRTLISNDRDHIFEFFAKNGPKCIVKTMSQPATGMIDAHHVSIDQLDLQNVTKIPTIFQEYIPGCTHLRILMMRDRIMCFEFESADVDWRRDVPGKFRLVDLKASVADRLRQLQRSLGLSMSVVDMKRGNDDSHVFLELNPQGQFLFMEPLSDVPLTEIFADFLISEASDATLDVKI